MDADRAESICPGCSGNRQLRWQLGDRLFRTTDKQFGIQECPDCSLLFLWPVPPADELAGYYPFGYWAGDPSVTGDPSVNGAGLIKAAVGGGERILLGTTAVCFEAARETRPDPTFGQIQSHTRTVTECCQERAVAATHIEQIDCALAEMALYRDCPTYESNVVAEHEATVGLGDPSMVVTMFHFLEHVPAPDTTLAHVRRMLKPEGELIVQVPNCASLQAQIFGRHWAGYDVPRHRLPCAHRQGRGQS